jgi:hypothetical protein
MSPRILAAAALLSFSIALPVPALAQCRGESLAATSEQVVPADQYTTREGLGFQFETLLLAYLAILLVAVPAVLWAFRRTQRFVGRVSAAVRGRTAGRRVASVGPPAPLALRVSAG